MTKTGRNATVPLVAAAVLMMAGRASAQDEPTSATAERKATIVLHVTNYAALSSHVLNVASARVAMVYELVGVRIAWVDGEASLGERQDGRLHLSILLLSREMTEKGIATGRIKDGVLGRAHISSGRAHIFCDRIATTPGALERFPIPLGNVIAHEVGHLVLGANSHSPSGIMRANVDARDLQLQSFNNKQARAIRSSLANLE